MCCKCHRELIERGALAYKLLGVLYVRGLFGCVQIYQKVTFSKVFIHLAVCMNQTLKQLTRASQMSVMGCQMSFGERNHLQTVTFLLNPNVCSLFPEFSVFIHIRVPIATFTCLFFHQYIYLQVCPLISLSTHLLKRHICLSVNICLDYHFYVYSGKPLYEISA